MWMPFTKHNTEHDNIAEAMLILGVAVRELQDSIRELREEVDYLVDFLDD